MNTWLNNHCKLPGVPRPSPWIPRRWSWLMQLILMGPHKDKRVQTSRKNTIWFSVHLYCLMLLCSYILSSDWGQYPDSQDLHVSHACHWPQHLLHVQGQGPYATKSKKTKGNIKEVQKHINEKLRVKESDTGLAALNLWDFVWDREWNSKVYWTSACFNSRTKNY